MGRPSAWRWMRPAGPKRRTSRSRSSTCAACPLSTCPPSWRRCRRRIARSWFTRRRSSVGLAVKSPPGSATTASTCWRRRWPASVEWMRRIRRRATRSSTCRMSIGFSKLSTSPSPMADQTFRLPDLGEGLTEAQLVSWRVEEGAHVEVNEPLCDVETAKAVVVIPSPFAGTIQKLHARPGESVAVGSPLVTISGQGAAAPVEPQAAEGVEATPGTLVGYGPGAGPQAGIRRRARVAPPAQQAGDDVRAAPFVRQLAKEKGVDLARLTGSGPDGRITRADVQAAASGAAAPTPAAATTPTAGERRI